MKFIVETRGEFMLQDPYGQEIPHDRPACVTMSNLFQQRVAKGQIKILLEGLKDDATDAEWVKTLSESEGDMTLALASMQDRFGDSVEEEEKPKPKGGRGRKASE